VSTCCRSQEDDGQREEDDGHQENQFGPQVVASHPIWGTEKEMTKYLRNKQDGFIYGWNKILAENPLCEEVTEEEAFPERFVNEKIVAKVTKTRAKTKIKALDLSTDDIQDEPRYVAPEIEADASKDLPE
jgi:hypothetical protein